MARRTRLFLGLSLALAGAFVALYPFVSVWRVAGQALDELPEISEVESSGRSHGLGALYDSEFVLATRSYSEVTPQSVREALASNGFEATVVNGSERYAKECCGDYDALWVEISSTDQAGEVLASATAADADIQTTIGLLVLFGLLLFVSGVAIAIANFSPSISTEADRNLAPEMEASR